MLVEEGGRVKKSDLVDKFRGSVESVDPDEKERNREIFKTFVNRVASVKEIDGQRYVVLKKNYEHLLEGPKSNALKSENEELPLTGEQQRPPAQAGSSEDPEEANEGSDHPTEMLSPIELALHRSKYASVRLKRVLGVEIQQQDRDEINCSNQPNKSKPYALPLRMPPSTTKVETHKLKEDTGEPKEHAKPDAFRDKRRMPSMERGSCSGSPQLRRPAKSTKASEEHKDTRIPSAVPLEQSEHDWLVKCAAGHWSQVYGLLLRDNQLAEKKDFMSGFTALHWAAKCGNSEMLVKIINTARQGGVHVDVNARTHGGYTPLHIAALHGRQHIIGILVKEYGASISIRDNYGKKACHYLHKDMFESVREMLCEPKCQPAPDRAAHEKEELDSFPDRPKGLHSMSRLFQPNVTGYKKKHKQRPGLLSLNDNPSEEGDDSGFRHRVMSDVFM